MYCIYVSWIFFNLKNLPPSDEVLYFDRCRTFSFLFSLSFSPSFFLFFSISGNQKLCLTFKEICHISGHPGTVLPFSQSAEQLSFHNFYSWCTVICSFCCFVLFCANTTNGLHNIFSHDCEKHSTNSLTTTKRLLFDCIKNNQMGSLPTLISPSHSSQTLQHSILYHILIN